METHRFVLFLTGKNKEISLVFINDSNFYATPFQKWNSKCFTSDGGPKMKMYVETNIHHTAIQYG